VHFFPSGGSAYRSSGKENPEPAHRRLPELGGSLRPQSSAADRMGRERRAQGDHVLPWQRRMAGTTLRRLLHLQSMEQGPSFRISVYSHQGSKLPHPRRQRSRFTHYSFTSATKPWADGDAVASFFPFQTTTTSTGTASSSRTEASADRLPQDRHLSRLRCRRAASRRPTNSAAKSSANSLGLLDPDPGTEVLQPRSASSSSLALLRRSARSSIAQLHLQAHFPSTNS